MCVVDRYVHIYLSCTCTMYNIIQNVVSIVIVPYSILVVIIFTE